MQNYTDNLNNAENAHSKLKNINTFGNEKAKIETLRNILKESYINKVIFFDVEGYELEILN